MMNSQATNPLALRSFEGLPNNGDPFLDCRLDREKYAEILTKIVLTYHRGFVLALSSDWGTGKTFFVKRWKKYLEHKEIQSIYFNAWENDFDNNALIALLAELQSVVLDQNRELYEKLIEKTSLIVKRILPTTIKLFSKILLRGEDISEILKELTAASLTTTSDSINDYIQKKKDIQDFKDALSAFVQSTNQDKPLVIFIDELDRCRPDYAVEVLEAVKHLFNIDGIVFVLSIDKKHLASSIKGYYGSEHINTDEYLRRFIDLEYTLPEPSTENFLESLFNSYSFENLFANHEDNKLYRKMLQSLSIVYKPTLRQLEKIIIQSMLILKSIGKSRLAFEYALALILYIKIFDNELYIKLVNLRIQPVELSSYFKIFTDSNKLSLIDNRFYFLGVGLLIWLLINSWNDINRERNSSDSLFDYSNVFKMWSDEEQKGLNEINNWFSQNYRGNTKLSFLLNKVESLDNLS